MNLDKLKPGSAPESAAISTHHCAEAHRCVLASVGSKSVAEAHQMLTRRSFVKTFGLFSAASLVGGKELSSLLVAEVSAQSSSLAGIFRMNLDNFAALRAEVGSVRLTVSGMPTSFRQIIVTRLEGSEFFAVSSECTHQGNPVSPMSLTSRRLVCPTHNSQFAPDGTLLGGQATRSLTAYNIQFDGEKMLSIEIPGLGFLVNVTSTVNAASQKRVQLEFPTVTGVRYNVQFRSALTDGLWTRVPFATAIDTVPALTTLTGNNAKATVFVEPTSESGFYAVGRGVTA